MLGFKAFLVHSGIDEFPHVGERELREAMPVLRDHGLPLLAHAELDLGARRAPADPRSYAGYLASRPRAWEDAAIALLIELCRETRCPVHIVHLASASAVDAIRRARDEGLPLTVETCPHYLCLEAEAIPDGATQFKCAPPIRERANREALWAALFEGVIDAIVSDHSPCPPAMKLADRGDFMAAWGGIASLQHGLAVVWTEAARRGARFDQLARWMSAAPARLAGPASIARAAGGRLRRRLGRLGSRRAVHGRGGRLVLPPPDLALRRGGPARARAPDVRPRARGLRRRRTSGRADRPRPAASGGRVSETAATAAAFTGLIDLAALGLGGKVLGASDDFFASANNLIEPGRGVFIEGKYTDRGKWMDGWESRRKRGPGYDWCVLELGAPGMVRRLRRRHALLRRQQPGVRVDRGRPRAARHGADGAARHASGASCCRRCRCGPTRRTCSRRRRARR